MLPNILLGLLSITASAQADTVTHPQDEGLAAHLANNVPQYFIRNEGQLDPRVQYYQQVAGHGVYFTRDGIYFTVLNDLQEYSRVSRSHQITLWPVGASEQPEVIGVNRQLAKYNYLLGADPQQWKLNVPSYDTVVYREIYPDVDLRFVSKQGELEYDIVVRPGADPAAVHLAVGGASAMHLNETGQLEIALGDATLIQHKPVIYQEIEGKRVAVEGTFRIVPGQAGAHKEPLRLVYGFDIGPYDRNHELVIDPVLTFSTYLGGSSNDYAYGVGVDAAGNTYVAGFTQSNNFPLSSPLQGVKGSGDDGFISKFDPTGTILLYSTYLGGNSTDQIFGLAVDATGNAYVTGMTTSTNFPSVFPYQDVFAGVTDGFVAKLDPTGSALIYSTYLGGGDFERPEAIAVDDAGNVAVTGYTSSMDYPLQTPVQPALGGSRDAFVTKFTSDGSALIHSTYLGGSLYDWGYGIATDDTGNTYVTGYTKSTDFPAVAPYQAGLSGVQDAFVAKFNADGSALSYATYLGGSSDEAGYGIVADAAGNAYLTGYTQSADFPVVSPFQATKAFDGDVFVTKFNPDGSALAYSTFLGGNGWDQGNSLVLDVSGRVCVTGMTRSTDFPLMSPFQADHMGLEEAFVTKFAANGAALFYSTYLGSTGNDSSLAIAADLSGDVIIAGRTQDVFTDFPLSSPFQGIHGGGIDAFVTRLNDFNAQPDITVTDSIAPFDDLLLAFGPVAIGVTALETVTITNDGGGDLQVQDIELNWLLDPPYSMENNPCSWQILAPGESCTLTIGFTPTDAVGSSDIFDIRSDDPIDWFVLVNVSGSGVAPQEPVPDIKANGVDGPMQIVFGTPLQVDVSLRANDAVGQAADWWLAAEAPDGLYWYEMSGSWVKSAVPVPTYTGALFDLASREVLNSSNLPVGSYRINFGVDTNANGTLDFDALFVDTVDVTIQ